MKTRNILILGAIGLTLFVSFPTASANAECYYCNPLLFPFVVAGAVVGTAAAIVTAPFCPYCGPHYYAAPPPPPAPPTAYYAPAPAPYRAWIRGHYNRNGQWVPGHWRYYRRS